jgi:hypothetical protein
MINMLKLPSLTLVTQQARRTLARFPLALVSAFIGTASAMLLIERGYSGENSQFLNNLLMTAALGLPLFITLAIFSEKRNLSRTLQVAIQATGVMLLAVYFTTLPEDVFSAPSYHLTRFFLLNIGLHLGVAFIPYLSKGEVNGFWQYNKTLFLRFLTAGLYSAVLYIGLVIALQALEHLFGVTIKEVRYGQLWVLITGVFNTWFFLAGVPENLAALDQETTYPRGLKVFTQFILIPLVLVYIIILYAYEFKIILAQDWPRGWVANLVLGFSVTGILAILLVHPLRNQEKHTWIATFAKWYYAALIPLIIMLLLAIWRRIIDYSFTENRYFVLILAIWLAITVIYFLFSRAKNIKFIPLTLCLLAFLASGGPWGAFQISERSQVNRLKEFLLKNDILVEGKVRKISHDISFNDQKEICMIITYLHRNYGTGAIQGWFDEDLQSLGMEEADSSSRHLVENHLPAAIVGLMGLSYVNQWEYEETSYFQFSGKAGEAVDINEYDYFIGSLYIGIGDSVKTVTIPPDTFVFTLNRNALTIANRAENDTAKTMRILISPLIQTLFEKYGASRNYDQIPAPEMSLEQTGYPAKVKIYITNISWKKQAEEINIEFIQMNLFITW